MDKASGEAQAQAFMANFMQLGQNMSQQFLQMMQNNLDAGANAQTTASGLTPDQAQLKQLQTEFARQHSELWSRMLQQSVNGQSDSEGEQAPARDRRFKAEQWHDVPYFNYLRQAYLINADFLRNVVEATPIEDQRMHERMQFFARQVIDACAPSNFAATNPEFIQRAIETKGESITAGIKNLLDDLQKGHISMTDESAFEVGRNLATTPGAVVFENELMQLIQYAPATPKVFKTPLLIVPPCINKFYIMDLQPENSLVRFIVEQGYTVFLISWKNPDQSNANATWEDYLSLGPLTALETVREITGVAKPHALSFCIGGTILASALAVAAARGEDPVASVTFMTTLLDFSEPGELGCLVDETSLAAREAAIGKGGLMPGQELANVFSFLRANDLVWQYVVENYLKGGAPRAFDLLHWNCDCTNLAGPFLTWYLRNFYLNNSLRVPNRLTMLGEKIDLGKITAPAYFMAAREDHIVPWLGAYLGRQLVSKDNNRFVLGASGHIAGAINPVTKNRRSYWVNEKAKVDIAAEDWLAGATEHAGSWWNDWQKWAQKHNTPKTRIAARAVLGSEQHPPIEPAPGRYVKQKA